jgi:dipeptidase D
VLTIGCAGGADSRLELPLAETRAADRAGALELRISGLRGGHSGIDIHLQRANAVKLLARALGVVLREQPLELGALRGGNAHNAIPREASATVAALRADVARRTIEAELQAARGEYRAQEPGLEFTVAECAVPGRVKDAESTAKALRLLDALPHGVVAMSQDIPGLVETSTNLAVVDASGAVLAIRMASRSSVASALAALRRRIHAIGTLAGAKIEEGGGYPGWKPNPDSPLLAIVRRVHREVTGRDPEVGAIHAGLECGIIGEKYPGMDMISFGPQIEFPHSPDERVKIDSVAPFYRLLTATLASLE